MAVEQAFEPEPHSAQAVRRFVAEVLPDASRLDDIVLAASELASNVIRHAGTSFTVRLASDHEKVRIEVSDGSSIVPAFQELTEAQRGLRMIDAIAEDWGVKRTDDGKIIWAEFDPLHPR